MSKLRKMLRTTYRFTNTPVSTIENSDIGALFIISNMPLPQSQESIRCNRINGNFVQLDTRFGRDLLEENPESLLVTDRSTSAEIQFDVPDVYR